MRAERQLGADATLRFGLRAGQFARPGQQLRRSGLHKTLVRRSSSESSEKAPRATWAQLRAIILLTGIPMIGFGFADNFIMIIAGDAIDAHLGMKFGISTMAAAALGNLVSDVAGIGLGDLIEAGAARLGISIPAMAQETRNLLSTRMVKGASGVIGISIGCLLGMTPLLFLDNRKELYFSEKDMSLFKRLFEPYGVTPESYFSMLKAAEWKTARPGELLIEQGVPLHDLISINHGEATSVFKAENGKEKRYCYTGVDFDLHSERPEYSLRGSIIGGTALVDPLVLGSPYPNRVIARTRTEYLKIKVDTLRKLMDSDKCLKAAIFGTLYQDVVQGIRWDKQNKYAELQKEGGLPSKESEAGVRIYELRLLLEAVVADGLVHPLEKKMVREFRDDKQVTTDEFKQVLESLDWSLSEWDDGVRTRGLTMEEASDIGEIVKLKKKLEAS